MAEVIDLGEYGARFREDPHPVYAELRALGPVHRVRLPVPDAHHETWLDRRLRGGAGRARRSAAGQGRGEDRGHVPRRGADRQVSAGRRPAAAHAAAGAHRPRVHHAPRGDAAAARPGDHRRAARRDAAARARRPRGVVRLSRCRSPSSASCSACPRSTGRRSARCRTEAVAPTSAASEYDAFVQLAAYLDRLDRGQAVLRPRPTTCSAASSARPRRTATGSRPQELRGMAFVLLVAGPRDDGQPHLERRPRAAHPPRPTRRAARRHDAPRRRRRGDAALRGPGGERDVPLHRRTPGDRRHGRRGGRRGDDRPHRRRPRRRSGTRRRTASTSGATPAATSPSGTASTTAWARPWPAWKPGSPSAPCWTAARTWRSTGRRTTGCPAC